MSRTFRAEEHEALSQMPQEGEGPNMSVFSGFAILLTVALVSLGIFVLPVCIGRRSAAAPDGVIVGDVLFSFSLVLALLNFLSWPAVE